MRARSRPLSLDRLRHDRQRCAFRPRPVLGPEPYVVDPAGPGGLLESLGDHQGGLPIPRGREERELGLLVPACNPVVPVQETGEVGDILLARDEQRVDAGPLKDGPEPARPVQILLQRKVGELGLLHGRPPLLFRVDRPCEAVTSPAGHRLQPKPPSARSRADSPFGSRSPPSCRPARPRRKGG